ncbi:MAG: MmcQ/YjbR family DNA-binding protein [Candidatus Acidiferrales bacterium]|jgi:predicted DNA-binding protein (MmcQ/YjbR family)
MNIDWLRDFCLSLAHTTEQIQWKDNLVFKVGGKMYAVAALEPGAHWLSLKCSDENYAELIESPGIIPAPYLARAHWVAIESEDTLPRAELKQLLTHAHALVFANLPKKTQAALSRPRARRKSNRRARREAGRPS